MSRRRVYVAYTGGTIGMRRTDRGWAPEPGFLEAQLRALPEVRDDRLPQVEFTEYAPLLDSSNMGPADWLRIARDIADRHEDFDGFVVVHGTDTMAYTASALPFLLRGLRKPVVLTGSQIPMCEVRSDARENLVTALLIAAHEEIPEVCLYFGGSLLRGCRATKVDASGFQAFASPNLLPLARAGIDIEVRRSIVRDVPPPGTRPEPPERLDAVVAALRVFPGISAGVLRQVLRPPLRGLVLEAYGTGNAPDRDEELLAGIAAATPEIVVVDCTQCLRGSVDLGAYATGSALLRAGVVSGFDMTVEAALAKLTWLLSTGRSPDQTRALVQQDLCGELSVA